MKILITGGCGFVGSNLAIFLNKKKKIKVETLDNLTRKGSRFNLLTLKKNSIKNYNFDILNYKKFSKLKKYDLIIDCCAEASIQYSKKNINKVLNTNLIGTFNTLKKASMDKSKIIFLSTSRVYSINKIRENYKKNNLKLIDEKFSNDSPISIYGFTKLASEKIIQEYSYIKNIRFIINRCGVLSGYNQFGKQDQGFLSLWVWSHLIKKNLKYIGFGGKGEQSRDVLDIDDLNNLIYLQILKFDKINNKIFNVGGGKKNSITLKRLTYLTEKVTKNKVNFKSIRKTSNYDVPYFITNNNLVAQTYNWYPKSNINELLIKIYNWQSKNIKNIKKYF